MRQEVTYELVGQTLQVPIAINGQVLVNEGVVLTKELIARLLKRGIKYIDVVSEETKDTSTTIEQPNTVSDELCNKVRASLIADNVDEIEAVAQEMISSVLNITDLDGGFSNLKYDLETFSNLNSLDHSIRVAIFSIIVAYLYNQNLRKKIVGTGAVSGEVNINDVAVAALMHDEGSNKYDPTVLNKIEALATNEKFKVQFPGIKDVPLNGYDDSFISIYSFCLIENLPDLSSDVKYMVLFSMETENELGPLKPQGFRNNNSNIGMGAKIIRLCSYYDNFLAHCYSTGESFENVITILGQAANTGAVNADLTDLFLAKVPIYPIGAKVILSNGEKAEVVKSYTGYTYNSRPIVKIDSTGEIIDLRYATTITINRVCQEEESLEQVVDRQIKEIDKGRK